MLSRTNENEKNEQIKIAIPAIRSYISNALKLSLAKINHLVLMYLCSTSYTMASFFSKFAVLFIITVFSLSLRLHELFREAAVQRCA